jgi:hypothetical protein
VAGESAPTVYYPNQGSFQERYMRTRDAERYPNGGSLVHAAVSGGVTITDDFNRVDAATLGPDWTNLAGSFSISVNVAQGAAGNSNSVHNTTLSSSDQYVQGNANSASNSNRYSGVILRGADLSTQTFYLLQVNSHVDGCILNRVVNGVITQIGTGPNGRGSLGSLLRIEAVGSTITAFVDGVQQVSVVDTAISSGPHAGIHSGDNGSGGIDNFEAGDL